MTGEFFGGVIFGVLLAFCVAALIYLLIDVLEKSETELDVDQVTPLVIDRKLARYVVKILEHDNRPSIEELVKQLKRALG